MKKNRSLSPVYEIDIVLLSKIAYKVWPKSKFNELDTLSDCKNFYNLAYNEILHQIKELTKKYHAAAWVREGYIQLEIWSMLNFNERNKTNFGNIKGPAEFGGVGRYGWSYIIELCLERCKEESKETTLRPKQEDLITAFTLLVALSHCSEYSNYLHYFKDQLSSAKVKLSPYIFLHGLKFSNKETTFYKSIISYMHQLPNYRKHKDFAVDNDEIIMSMINKMLDDHFGFNLDVIRSMAEAFFNKVIPEIKAAILVTTYEDSVITIADYSKLPIEKVDAALSFVLLDTNTLTLHPRDFLIKSQHRRMLNYAGVTIEIENNLESIYDSKAAKYQFVRQSKKHIILAGTLLLEWADIFTSRLVYGQRQDLKDKSPELKYDISAIESYYHINIFEEKLKNLLRNKGFSCISVNKIGSNRIPCGQIDIIAYNPSKYTLHIIEAKNHSPAKDAKSMGKVISDHFKQKDYHRKFIGKITWVGENIDAIRKIFKATLDITIAERFKTESFFITGSANAVKYLVSEYKVLTFFEYDNILNGKK